MVLEGDIRELKRIFSYATHTKCILMYFNVHGDIFLLYEGGHYVYFKTVFFTPHNLALPYVSYYNIYQFIKAELRRAKLQDRKIDMIRIEEEQITVSASVKIVHNYQSKMYRDELFSPTTIRLGELKGFTPAVAAPAMRIQKKIFKDYFRKVNQYRRQKESRTFVYVSDNQLHVERIHESQLLNIHCIYDDGFYLLRHAAHQMFQIHEDAIRLLVQLKIPEDDYIYVTKDQTFFQLEYDGMPGKFRFFMPNQNEIENSKKVISRMNN